MRLEAREGPIEAPYERALGRRTGLVNELRFFARSRGGPRVFGGGASTCDFGSLVGLEEADPELGVGGKGRDVSSTFTRCLGEVFERYSNLWHDDRQFELASYRELRERGDPVVEFEYIDVYDTTPLSRSYRDLTRETQMPWARGTNLLTGESTYVPAELVWMRADESAPEGPSLPGTSNGLAAGRSLREALLGSILEVVERDGFLRTWLCQSPERRIDLDSVPEVRAEATEVCPDGAFDLHVVEHGPVVDLPAFGACLVNDADEYPKFVIGGAAEIDPTEAIREAVYEVAQGWPNLFALLLEHPGDAESDLFLDFERNVFHYARPENFEDVSFLVEGPRSEVEFERPDAAGGSVGERVAHCLDRLAEAGCRPIAFDVTSPDVRELGVRATKVFVPECLQLTPPSVPPADHPTLRGEAVTEKPHPFP